MHSSSSRQQHTTRLRLRVRPRAGHSIRGVLHHGIVHNITTTSSTSCIMHATHRTYVQRRTRRRDDRWLYLRCLTAPVASEAARFFFFFISCTGSSSTMTASEPLPRVWRGEPGSDSTPTVSSSLSTTVGDAGEDAGEDSADASSAAQRWAARAPQAADNESDARKPLLADDQAAATVAGCEPCLRSDARLPIPYVQRRTRAVAGGRGDRPSIGDGAVV